MVKRGLADLVEIIDPRLEFIGFIGEGTFSVVLEVQLRDTNLALKINKKHQPYHIDQSFTLEHEFKVMKELEGVKGIPKVFKLYSQAPCLNNPKQIGKNAYLRELITGKSMDKAGKQGFRFFVELNELMDRIAQSGYSILTDLGPGNILVGKNESPYLIDMMCAIKLSNKSELRIRQLALVRERIESIKERYLFE